MARFTLVAISNPADGQADACGAWYDDTHLPDMLKVPGILNAQRLELLRGAPRKAFKQFLTIYEIEADDEAAARGVIDRLNATDLPLSDTLDVSSVNLGIFQATGPVQHSD